MFVRGRSTRAGTIQLRHAVADQHTDEPPHRERGREGGSSTPTISLACLECVGSMRRSGLAGTSGKNNVGESRPDFLCGMVYGQDRKQAEPVGTHKSYQIFKLVTVLESLGDGRLDNDEVR